METILKNPMHKLLPFLSGWGPAGHDFRGQKDLGASCASLLLPNSSVFLMHSLSQPKHFASLITLCNAIFMLLESVSLAGRAAALGKV